MAGEKKRAPNFTREEEYLLVELVNKRKLILECKKSGAHTWREKETAWNELEKEFNSACGKSSYKNAKTLKLKYTNMKKKTKEKFSYNKYEIERTEGGVASQSTIGDIDDTIKSPIGPQLEGISNNYDSDPNPIAEMEVEEEIFDNEENVIIEIIEDNSQPQHEIEPGLSTMSDVKENTSDWASYTSATLKQLISQKLKKCKRRPLYGANGSKIYTGLHQQLIEETLNFIKLQKEKFLEEHALRVDLLKK